MAQKDRIINFQVVGVFVVLPWQNSPPVRHFKLLPESKTERYSFLLLSFIVTARVAQYVAYCYINNLINCISVASAQGLAQCRTKWDAASGWKAKKIFMHPLSLHPESLLLINTIKLLWGHPGFEYFTSTSFSFWESKHFYPASNLFFIRLSDKNCHYPI